MSRGDGPGGRWLGGHDEASLLRRSAGMPPTRHRPGPSPRSRPANEQPPFEGTLGLHRPRVRGRRRCARPRHLARLARAVRAPGRVRGHDAARRSRRADPYSASPRGENLREVRASTTFAIALLLMAGPAAAMIAMAIATIVCGVRYRHASVDIAFDVAARSIALWCASAVLQQFDVNALTHNAVRIERRRCVRRGGSVLLRREHRRSRNRRGLGEAATGPPVRLVRLRRSARSAPGPRLR